MKVNNRNLKNCIKKDVINRRIIILVVLFFVVTIFDIYLYFNSSDYILRKKGYTEKNIKLINKVLDDSAKKRVYDMDYNKYLLLIINDENFISKNLTEYLRYYNEFQNTDYDANILKIINEKYYISDNYNRYINYYLKNPSFDSKQIVENVNCNVDKEYYSTNYEVDLKNGILVLVNKYNKLTEKYVPADLVKIEKKYGYEKLISKTAYDAYIKMFDDAKKDDKKIYIVSAYRNYSYQKNLYNKYVNESGKIIADRVSARAGYSEHQTGLAIDISTENTSYTKFGNTDEFKWMIDNSYKYGFILRYPENKEKQTGYKFEPWHYRYVGKKVAKYIYDNNITYDEYYEYFLKIE